MIWPLIASNTDIVLIGFLCSGKRIFKGLGRLFLCICLNALCLLVSYPVYYESNLFSIIAKFLILALVSRLCTDTHAQGRYLLIILLILIEQISGLVVRNLPFYKGEGAALCLAILLYSLLKIGGCMAFRRFAKGLVFGMQSLGKLLITVLPALPFFFLIDYIKLQRGTVSGLSLELFAFSLLFGCCVLLNIILGMNMAYQSYVNANLRMEALMQKQKQHYAAAEKAAESVGRIYHDLKHTMRAVANLGSAAEIKACLAGMEASIDDYGLLCDTGNSTMDVILSEKMGECRRKGIELRLYANGQDWQDILSTDIAILFGNALDNAIESVEQTEKAELRRIDVRVNCRNGMRVARFENPYTHPLQEGQAGFMSTKGSRAQHGFGLKSIGLMVKRYGGDMDIAARDETFVLTVLIPKQAGISPT